MAGSDIHSQALYAHLEEGTTTTCRCWYMERKDGWARGFTDHDGDLAFDGMTFVASSGFTASTIETTTGLSVDNTEVLGALSEAGITEEDIEAGRFDRASVTHWLVNWRDTEQRVVRFRGVIGEVTRNDDAFSAELRGVAELLNQPRGHVFQRSCAAVLGDGKCRFDLSAAGFSVDLPIVEVDDAHVFRVDAVTDFEDGWFERGRISVIDGAGAGLWGWIKNDLADGDLRELTLWQGMRADINVGDTIRLEAGCDKTAATCANKFGNFLNFRGFPHIPGEDWLTSYPRSGEDYGGGSMNAPIVS